MEKQCLYQSVNCVTVKIKIYYRARSKWVNQTLAKSNQQKKSKLEIKTPLNKIPLLGDILLDRHQPGPIKSVLLVIIGWLVGWLAGWLVMQFSQKQLNRFF